MGQFRISSTPELREYRTGSGSDRVVDSTGKWALAPPDLKELELKLP